MDVLWTIHAVGNDDSELACNTCKKYIRFHGSMVSRVPSGNAHVDFHVVNGMFYNASDFIKGIPFFVIPLETGEHAKVYVFVSISRTSFRSSRVGIFTVADIFYHVNHGTNSFDAVRPSFFTGNALIFHGKGGIIETGWIIIFIVTDFF